MCSIRLPSHTFQGRLRLHEHLNSIVATRGSRDCKAVTLDRSKHRVVGQIQPDLMEMKQEGWV